RVDLRAQALELRLRFEVAREEDDAAHQRMQQPLALVRLQRAGGDVDDDRTARPGDRRCAHRVSLRSIITKASALSRSSDSDTCATSPFSSRCRSSALRATATG